MDPSEVFEVDPARVGDPSHLFAPKFIDKSVKVVLEESALRPAHFVHESVDMEQFHGGGVLSDMEQLPMRMFCEDCGFSIIDGKVVGVVLAWLSPAEGTECCLNRRKRSTRGLSCCFISIYIEVVVK